MLFPCLFNWGPVTCRLVLARPVTCGHVRPAVLGDLAAAAGEARCFAPDDGHAFAETHCVYAYGSYHLISQAGWN